MAGFLDQKERVMDTIITQEGRSQLARFGKLNPTYYSFSDAGVVYDVDTIVSGSTVSGLEADETYRPMFESVSLPQDTIAFEKNDAGFVNRLIGQSIDVFYNWQVTLKQGEFYGTVNGSSLTAPLADLLEAVGSSNSKKANLLEQYANTILTSSFTAFTNQQILRSPDPVDNVEKTFSVSPNKLNFDFSDTAPIQEKTNQEADISHIESLFWDKRLSHADNFTFLPPVQKSEIGATELVAEDNYQDLSQNSILSFANIKQELLELERQGSMKEILFNSTTLENNLFSQIFEYNKGKVSKLDVVDFGLFKDEGITKHLFFIGKLYQDNFGQSTFVNMFTFVYELAEI